MTWLIGPLIAVSLLAFSVLGNAGPGFFFWTMFAGIGFLGLAPLIQWGLLKTSKFKERAGSACAVSLGFIATCAAIGLFSGAFNFW